MCGSKVSANHKRMKGFRMIAAKVWQTRRELIELGNTVSDARPNCSPEDWHEPVFCDSGHVASGINVYWDDDDHSIVGLGLRCRKVSWLGSEQ